MNLREVRAWAQRRGISGKAFRRAYDDAFSVAVSGLLRAVYREGLVPPSSLQRHGDGTSWLRVGGHPKLVVELAGALPLQRFETVGVPSLERDNGSLPLRSTRAFTRALRPLLVGDEIEDAFERLRADFDDSFANLVLNRLLFELGGASSRAIEPAFQGHTIHPFPALRRGPSLSQVVACSHLSHEPVALPLAKLRGASFYSATFADAAACARAWAGWESDPSEGILIPVHPWQLTLSPIVQGLLSLKVCALCEGSVPAMPLASQRTCRVLATGFDVKLPIDATLTGEHRLLFPANVRNAPFVSALARAALALSTGKTLEFQCDVASITHPDPTMGAHLCAIVREPLPSHGTDRVVPALNLWLGRCEAQRWLRLDTSSAAEEVFAAYCRVLMKGPLELYGAFGLALEPHLQNVLVRIRDGAPCGIVVRDLDSTILDVERVPSLLRQRGLELPVDVWQDMSPFTMGGARLTHAMLHGHLAIVAAYLVRRCGVDARVLDAIVEDTWDEILAYTPTSVKHFIVDLRSRAESVKCLLRMRLAGTPGLLFSSKVRTP